MVHVLLLRVCTQFYYVQELCDIFGFGSYFYPHKTVIILRNTIINNSRRRLRFLLCYGRAQCLSWVVHQTIVRAFYEQHLSWVVHQTIVRGFNRYLFLMNDIFHVFSNIYKLPGMYCCVTFVLLFDLRYPRDSTSHTCLLYTSPSPRDQA